VRTSKGWPNQSIASRGQRCGGLIQGFHSLLACTKAAVGGSVGGGGGSGSGSVSDGGGGGARFRFKSTRAPKGENGQKKFERELNFDGDTKRALESMRGRSGRQSDPAVWSFSRAKKKSDKSIRSVYFFPTIIFISK